MKTLVTGSRGFIGRHMMEALGRADDVEPIGVDLHSTPDEWRAALAACDAVIHLAGVNRPQDPSEFATGNADLTGEIASALISMGRSPMFLLSSSTQAEQDNPYGRSKRAAEEAVARYAGEANAPAAVFRLTNVFGKWCRPNYNSAVATFCHNIARGEPVSISDPNHEVRLVYIDDVVAAFLGALRRPPAPGTCARPEAGPIYPIRLGDLVARIEAFRAGRHTLLAPDVGDAFTRRLYATYLSHLPEDGFAYALEKRTDPRGSLAEFIKSPPFGQIFVSRTAPGITRGNHYHHTKTEKFLVLEGEAVIRFRRIDADEVIVYRARGEEYRVVDIPPGYTHDITNVGESDLVTLFWASEIFDPQAPDTHALKVEPK